MEQQQALKPDHVITRGHMEALLSYLSQRPYREVAELIQLTASLPTVDQYLHAIVAKRSEQASAETSPELPPSEKKEDNGRAERGTRPQRNQGRHS